MAKFAEKIKDKLYVQRRLFPKNRVIYKMWENVEPDRPQITQNDACTLHAG